MLFVSSVMLYSPKEKTLQSLLPGNLKKKGSEEPLLSSQHSTDIEHRHRSTRDHLRRKFAVPSLDSVLLRFSFHQLNQFRVGTQGLSTDLDGLGFRLSNQEFPVGLTGCTFNLLRCLSLGRSDLVLSLHRNLRCFDLGIDGGLEFRIKTQLTDPAYLLDDDAILEDLGLNDSPISL